MTRQIRRRFYSFLLVCGLFALPAAGVRADLLEYVHKPEPHFAWKLKQKIENAAGVIYDLQMTSQTWEGIDWTHQLQVYQPKDVKPNAVMLLFNTGGKANPGNILFGMELAKKVGSPLAILYGIPNQPLLGGKKEDALIAETFVRFLATKDADWPLLFPMAKSVVKAMDALAGVLERGMEGAGKEFRHIRGVETRLDDLADGGGRPARQGHRADGHRHAEHGRADETPKRNAGRLQPHDPRLHRARPCADPTHGGGQALMADDRPLFLPRSSENAETARSSAPTIPIGVRTP